MPAEQVVDFVASIGPEGDAIQVRFRGGKVGKLNPAVSGTDKVWEEVLKELQQDELHAYVEIDSHTGNITRLLQPRTYRVKKIETVPGSTDLKVELEISHVVHYVRAGPGFDQIKEVLEAAKHGNKKVLVTRAIDGSKIVHARFAEES